MKRRKAPEAPGVDKAATNKKCVCVGGGRHRTHTCDLQKTKSVKGMDAVTHGQRD